jgi:GrpB-like predicted nucleotidyltransferase (UPF0157 family)
MAEIKKLTKIWQNTEYNPYDPNLPEAFQEIKKLIHQKLPGVRVEHVGSSSVPGIGGRNALDIVVPADEKDHETFREKLSGLGFYKSPWEHFMPVQVGMFEYKSKDYPVLLYVMSGETQHFKGLLMYRDYMRSHPEDAKSYDMKKQEVINSGKTGNDQYQEAKTPFILSMVEKIRNSQK